MGMVSCDKCGKRFDLNMVDKMLEKADGFDFPTRCLKCNPEQGLEKDWCHICGAYPMAQIHAEQGCE